MPIRQEALSVGEIYHIFNRGINKQNIFRHRHDYNRLQETLWFYRIKETPFSLSKYHLLDFDQRLWWRQEISKEDLRVKIMAYCLMPNHFHLLVEIMVDGEFSWFMSQIQNSYTKYFNKFYERTGQLISGQFRAVKIHTNEQMIHVSRYIHLNPVTAFLVSNVSGLDNYDYSSWAEYMGRVNTYSIVDSGLILNQFKSCEEYRNFVSSDIDNQRDLHDMRKIMLDI